MAMMGRPGKGTWGGRSSEAGMFIFLSLQILAAHFDDLQAGRLYSSARVCAGESNGSPRRNPITLTFNSMKSEWRQGAALQSFERAAGAGFRSCPLTAACAMYARF